MLESALLVAVVIATLGFAFTNGFHDASNSVATAVATGALTPRSAVVLAAFMNFLGAAVSTSLAWTISLGLIHPNHGSDGLVLLLAGVVGAIGWNLLTWWWGMPSSSSHALFAGLAGAALLSPGVLDFEHLASAVVLPLLISPVIGLVLALVGILAVHRFWHDADVRTLNPGFRYAQVLSGSAVAFGHGLQDAQKSMAVVLLALTLVDAGDTGAAPWVIVGCALAIALGTLSGGWRVTRTLARRIAPMDPARGFVAEAVSAGVLAVAALALRVPVSTTHTLVSAIVGTGVGLGVHTVQWNVVLRMVLVWVATPLAAAGLALLVRLVLLPVG